MTDTTQPTPTMDTPLDDLTKVQLQLEEEAVGLGIERYRKEVERGLEDTHPGRVLVRETVKKLSVAIEEYIKDAQMGAPSRSLGVVKYLQQFDPDMVALVVATKVIRSIPLAKEHQRLQGLALAIAGLLEDSINYDRIKEEAPGLWKVIERKMKYTKNQRHRHIVIRKSQAYASVETVAWGLSERVRLGTLLIELMAHSTGLVKIETVWTGPNKSMTAVIPTEETLQWLEKSHSRSELLCPLHMPMVVPPRPWTSPVSGGYLSRPMRLKLVKTRNPRLIEELKGRDMPEVYRAINAMQNTRWAINKGILRVLKEAWERGESVGKLPPRDPIPLPPKDFEQGDAEGLKRWKAAAHATYTENIRLNSKRIAMVDKLWVAEKFSQFEAIYFVYSLDWRGRAYAVANYVSPQGDDSSKALLRFADGKPLGQGGAWWLAIHGANCYGADKVSFDERVQWVQEHQDQIIDSALRPLDGERFWCSPEVDKPWQFLAFCLEWTAFVMHCNAGRPSEEFVSHLPVSIDGSCNGLQNFSAATRDEVGGAATNLIPSEKPSDIYQAVADAANPIVDREAAAGNPSAIMWKGKVTRKITKRPTMTMPYGSGRYGYKDQLLDTIAKLEDETGKPYLDGDRFVGCLYLAGIMDKAIGQVVVKAREAMDWLQETARIVAKDGLPVRWTSPSGFLVVQDYRVPIGKRLDFTIAGRRYSLTVEIEGSELDKKKQAQGIAPNVVHSWDAAHLVATVNMCLDHGVTNFSMVHDSFGTHAADVDTLAYCLRRAFVDQYSEDVLGKLREELIEQINDEKLKAKVPPLPAYGKLDLEAVMQSEYFFA